MAKSKNKKDLVKQDIEYTMYEADPNCEHEMVQACFMFKLQHLITCRKCGGWIVL